MPSYLVIWTEMDYREEFPELHREETEDEEVMAKLVDLHPGCLVIQDAVICDVSLERKVIPKLILAAGPEIRKAAKEVRRAKKKGKNDGSQGSGSGSGPVV